MFPTVSQLDSFTDVFGDANEVEELLDDNLSQPLSLSTTCNTPIESTINGLTTNVETNRPAKHTGQHGEFRSVEEIDPKYRCLFTYPYFNLVQSRIIEDALYSDKSLVVCAPTGSGKTVVFELAVLQLLMQIEDAGSSADFKIIYMAPVKAVCNERLTEWYPRLTKLGLLCIEVTGDTEVDFSQLSPYRVIITTPEKWDMLTRRWRDHRGLVEMIKLFLIDEVHILNDETRGPVLEAVVSRMKTVESAVQSAHRIEQLQLQYQGAGTTSSAPPRIRFVAVSATVGNPEDVADWLGTNEKPAVFYKFGDEYRPVKLQRIVEGYSCAEGTSLFKFDLILNYKLWPIIQKYYNGKPTLIFCNTRKSVSLTAEALSREVTVTFSPEQKAKLTALASTLKNKKLQMLIMSGVGCHHAGLLYEERINIERAFRNRDLPILITTTTLAMGVNLPAHLVIVKNTQQYVNGAYQEYAMSTVLQMVGRAGRPQFDTSAVAVIMTRLQDKVRLFFVQPRYQALVGGIEPLQSYLHKRLAENLNSEAALGTVTDVAQCVEWLRSTFLYVRAAKDPKRYLGLPPAAPQQLISKKIEELCVKAMNSLASSGLITMDEASCIESTEAGRLMSLFYLDVETMKNIMKIEGTETLERLLWVICESHELSDMHLRVDERRSLNLLNRNTKAATIRFPMKGKISTRQMKLNCIIQAILGCLPIPEPALNQEAMKVMRTATRVCKCLVKYVSRPELVSQQPRHFSAVLNSIILSKCIHAHLWENSPYVSKQLKGIGPTLSTLLASAGLTSFMLLEESHPRDLERIMNKGPPAGNTIRKQVSLLPKYQLTVTPIDAQSITIQLMLLNHAYLSENMSYHTAGDVHKSYLVVGDTENHLLLLTQFTDKDFISVYDGTMKYEVTRKLSSEHKILIHCVSSSIVGIDVQADYLFLDLEPQPSNNSDHFLCSISNGARKNVTAKQTAITDVYKERKRKNENDITQCKEKKKREYTLTQKLKALKESFCKTSKTLKTDIDKSVETSNKIIHDLLDGKTRPNFPENSQGPIKTTVECPTVDLTEAIIDNTNSFASNSQVLKKVGPSNTKCPTVDLTKNMNAVPLDRIIINDDEDYIDDLQIDSILSKIESEISGNCEISNSTENDNFQDTDDLMMPNVYSNTRPFQEAEKVETKYTNMNSTPHLVNKISRCVSNTNKRKKLKSNYSFMDLIEKKANTGNESIKNSVDNGFSDAIKSQINTFLQQAQKTTKPATPVINELLETAVHDELPEVYIKSDLPSETKKHVEGKLQENIGSNRCDINTTLINQQDIFETAQYLLSGENDGSDGVDLPEVNVKNVKTMETNKQTENQSHSTTNDVKKPEKETVKYYKMDMCRTNKPEENNDFEGIFPTTQLNENLILNPIRDNKNIPENVAPTSNILWDNSMPDGTLQTMSTNVKPVPTLEVNQRTNVLVDTSNTSSNKSNQKTILQITNKLENNDFTEVNEKIERVAISESKQYAEGQVHSNNIDLEKSLQKMMKSKEMDICELQKPNKPEQSIDYGQTTQINAITTRNIITHSADSLKNVPHNSSSITRNKHEPVTSLEKIAKPSGGNKDLTPYHKLETVGDSCCQQPTNLKMFIPFADRHNIDITNDMLFNKVINTYQNIYQSSPIDICANSTNMILTDQTRAIQPSDDLVNSRATNLKPWACQENLKTSLDQPSSFNNALSVFSKNTHLSDTNHVAKQERHENTDNDKESYFKRFSYTATKVDVCTKRYAPDHELRITRKLKVDVDVTEIVKQDKNKTNEAYNGNTEKERDEIKPQKNIKATNVCENETSKSYNENANAINESNINVDSSKTILDSIEGNPNHSTTCNNIENILQKYSKILVKSETPTPIINKMHKIDGNASIKTTPNAPKSRKPFRISDINAMDLSLPDTLTKVNKPAITASQMEMEPIATAKRTKADTKENVELYEPKDIQMTPETDCNKSYESPVSVHSLQLDTIKDMKDENMFNPKDLKDENMLNPKLLLQYFTEDNNDIIAPPVDFSDNAPVYSPIASQETKEFYGNHYDLKMDNTENNFNSGALDSNSTNFQSSPKEIETWCFSKDEEDTYESPVRSSPWVISQRAHTNLGGRRPKLCQFKFVRKKTYRP